MITPKLSFVTPHHTDFNGAWFTANAFRTANAGKPWLKGAEIVLADNSPAAEDGRLLQKVFAGWWAKPQQDVHSIRYVPMPSPVGAANAKQRCFEEARGDVVLCVDSHVLLYPGAVEAVLDFFADPAHARDFLTGPLIYDDHQTVATHFLDRWRGQMWGTWGRAWRRPQGDLVVAYWLPGRYVGVGDLSGKQIDSTGPAPLDGPLERSLEALGWTPADRGSEPFEIPANGCGCFAMRRDAWVGFNEKFRGFGGEEWYVHEKVRRAGGKVYCHPALKWVHRFPRPGGVRFPNNFWDRVRNYVLGLHELGVSFDRLHRHFVLGRDEGGQGEPEGPLTANGQPLPPPINAAAWAQLTRDPANPPAAPVPPPAQPGLMTAGNAGRVIVSGGVPPEPKKPCSEAAQKAMSLPLETLYEAACKTPSDINEHAPALKELASRSEVVVEFGVRHGVSTTALLMGQPKRLVCCDVRPADQAVKALAERAGRTQFEFRQADSLTAEPVECDLLFIDTRHTEKQLSAELARHAPKCRRWVALHDTLIYGERGDDGGPGLLPALHDFLAKNHPTWFVVSHALNNNGFTVLSRNPEDKPAEPVALPTPGRGPGTELKNILASVGVNPAPTCDCNTKARYMDSWGVAGCRKNRDTVIQWLREGQDRWGWTKQFAKVLLHPIAAASLAGKVNWRDPIPGLVDEAVRRAEEKERQAGAA